MEIPAFLFNGFYGGGDLALAFERAAVGTFFAISGWHKLTVPARHAALVKTLKADGIPFVRFNEWFVPGVELVAGMLLAVGLFSVIAALLLGGICVVACLADGLDRIREYAPINRADWLDDLLYLPETLYGLMLLTTVLAGPGAYSLDTYVWR